MSTAVETPQTTATEEQLVAARPDVTLFMARRRELRLIKQGRYPVHAPTGQKIGETTGQIVVFRDGRLDVPHEGTMLLEDGRPAEAHEILEWLEKHPRNGDVNEGFWRVDPTAPTPTAVELQALMIAATELDSEKLEELIRQEEDGWARDAILTVARGALDRVRLMQEQAKTAAEAQQSTRDDEAAKLEAERIERDRLEREEAEQKMQAARDEIAQERAALEAEKAAIEQARIQAENAAKVEAQPDPPAEAEGK